MQIPDTVEGAKHSQTHLGTNPTELISRTTNISISLRQSVIQTVLLYCSVLFTIHQRLPRIL